MQLAHRHTPWQLRLVVSTHSAAEWERSRPRESQQKEAALVEEASAQGEDLAEADLEDGAPAPAATQALLEGEGFPQTLQACEVRTTAE